MNSRQIVLLALAGLVAPAPAMSQSPGRAPEPTVTIVRDEPECARCRVQIARSARLAAPRDGFPGTPQTLVQDGAGNIYTGYGFTVEFMKHSGAGRLLRHAQPEGEGPGEFRSIYTLLALRGDSILMIDAQLQRATVVDEAGKVARTVTFPTPIGAIVPIRDSILIVNSGIRQRDRVGLPLHEFTTTGGIGRSFGDADPTVRPGHEEDIARAFGAAGGDSVWVVRTSQRYDLELWRVGARAPTRILRRQADWFPPRQFPAGTVPTGAAPSPEVLAVWEDPAGRVWVMLRVADPRWKQALAEGGRMRGHGRSTRTYGDPSRYYDIVFEIIDPDRGVLLARHREDRLMGPTGTPGLLLQMTSARDEEPAFRVLSLALQAP